MDFNDLNKLSNEELLKVAEYFKLYDFKRMNREELLNSIADLCGIKKSKRVENNKLMKAKKSISINSSFVTCALICLALMQIIMFISGALSAFLLENKQLMRWQNSNEWGYVYLQDMATTGNSGIGYGYVAWNAIALIWTLYVLMIWAKRKIINHFVLISGAISLGYFILVMVNWQQNIESVKQRMNLEKMKGSIVEYTPIFYAYTKAFWASIITIPLFVLSSISTFCFVSFFRLATKNRTN